MGSVLGDMMCSYVIVEVIRWILNEVGNRWGLLGSQLSNRHVNEFLSFHQTPSDLIPFLLRPYFILHYTLVHASLLICINSKSITTYTYISTGSSPSFFISFYHFYIRENAP